MPCFLLACEAVTGAIRDIYAQDTANVRFEDLYR
jgi:hypothetical protein